MRDYLRIASKIKETPWLITPDSLSLILQIVSSRMDGHKLSDEEIDARLAEAHLRNEGRTSNNNVNGGVGVLPIFGPIFGKANLMTEMSGATSLEASMQDFKSLMNNDMVHSILLHVDSPGGTSDLVNEFADEIRAARDDKPVYAISDTNMCSAALWIGSQASALYSTKSGSVGSIGAYTVHEDQSVKDAQQGVKFTVISAGKYKTEGSPHEALSVEAQAYRQEVINEIYDSFVEGVALGRGVSTEKVANDFGQGRVLTAKKALDVGLIDGIMGYDELVGTMMSTPRKLTVAVSENAARALGFDSATNLMASLGTDGVFHLEEKEWGHSEPGTGPTPRTKEDGSDDPAIKGGWRRDTPPPGLDAPQEDEAMAQTMEEFLASFAQSIGLDANADADTVLAEAKKMSGEVAQLRELDADIENRKSFAQEYPDIAKRLEASEARGRRADAKEFRDRYSRFTVDGEDGTKIRTNQGFPSVVLDKVEAGYVSLVEGDFTVEMLSGMLDSIAKAGTVEYGELGTKLAGEDGLGNLNTETDPKAKFATRVNQYMESDNLDRHAALRMAAEKHPDEYEAYRAATPVVK